MMGGSTDYRWKEMSIRYALSLPGPILNDGYDERNQNWTVSTSSFVTAVDGGSGASLNNARNLYRGSSHQDAHDTGRQTHKINAV